MALSVSQLFSVAGKNVAITGGARGIGRMIANAFVQNGANVYISSRKADVCEEAVKVCSPHIHGPCCIVIEHATP
jgi:NAD(P)-dependent dehydrogenase (short-subunit alcohol dehydrogenase family)